jgi:TIR domain/Pentapeptide repeats (8 copies)
MANPEHLEILKQGDRWKKWIDKHPPMNQHAGTEKFAWTQRIREFLMFFPIGLAYQWLHFREEHPDIDPDLSEADLTGMRLWGMDLSSTNLHRANLGGTYLLGTAFAFANLSRASLRGADLTQANLKCADLSGADLNGAKLNGADLSEADFTGAKAGRTNFADVDLSVAEGLETIQHSGPSTVGIDTIYKSRGKIPEVFLRGCGVPDEFIAYIGSIVGRPIEFYSCFISYSTKDQDFAERLHADLQAKGVRCWFAPHDIKGGRKLHEQIDEAIRLHDKLLLILSEHSMNSNWVKTEIANAREREEREKKQMLFPIALAPIEKVKKWKLFDADRGIDSAREVREYFIPDFSNWKKHDSYQVAFQRLVSDLKAEARK